MPERVPQHGPRSYPAPVTRRSIFIASVCSGVLGSTVAEGLHLNVVLAYALTVVVVFVLTAAVVAYRER